MCYYANDTKCGKGGEQVKLTAGEKMRVFRKSINKSLEEVANDLGISYAAIQAYETNSRTPRDDLKRKIAKYYKTTVAAIFFND